MNEAQFNLIAEKLKLSTSQIAACKLVIFREYSCYAAEKEVLGKVTNTICRNVTSVCGIYKFALKVVN